MRKFYLLFAILLAFTLQASAKTFTFHLTIEDPTKVVVERSHYDSKTWSFIYEPIEGVELVKGLNEFSIDETSTSAVNFRIRSLDGYILKIHKADGSIDYTVKNDTEWLKPIGVYNSNNELDVTLTVKTISPEEYYDQTLTLTFDNPDKCKAFNIRNHKETSKPQEYEYELQYNSTYEDILYVSPIDSYTRFYQVLVDGEPATAESNGSYEIKLSDFTDEANPVYVHNVDVQANYPKDLNYNFKITTNDIPECITVTVNNNPIENFDAEDGFSVRPGSKVRMDFNTADYKITKVTRNGSDVYLYSSTTYLETYVYEDYIYEFTAEKLEQYTATIVADPELVQVKTPTNYGTEVALTGDETEITFTNKTADSDQFNINVKDKTAYEITRIYDETFDKEYTIATDGYGTNVKLADNSRLIVEATKIIRDKNVVVYVDKNKVSGSTVYIYRGASSFNSVVGYNQVEYRDQDEKIETYCYGLSSAPTVYRNGVNINNTAKARVTFTNVQDKEVFKVFYTAANAVEHTVNFDVAEGALDGYDVKQDIHMDVDHSAPVAAVGKTTFTIAPIARSGSDITITVGDNELEPVDGVYTFETSADTNVKVTSNIEAGISDITVDSNEAPVYYNLYGVQVVNPENGIFIVRQGNKITKKLVK